MRYQFVAQGQWKDWENDSGPVGYPSNDLFLRLARRLLRQPDADYFALIGALDQDRRTQFTIGAGTEHEVGRAGELTCFANDVPLFRWNNKGSLTLRVTRR